MQWLGKVIIQQIIGALKEAFIEWLEHRQNQKEIKKKVRQIHEETRGNAQERARRMRDLLNR